MMREDEHDTDEYKIIASTVRHAAAFYSGIKLQKFLEAKGKNIFSAQ